MAQVAFSYLGEMALVTGQVLDTEGAPVAGATLEWSTSDAVVVTVSGGSLEAVGPGQATVTASYEGLSAQVGIEVVQEPATVDLVYGGGQPVQVESQVPDPIRVRLLDSGGTPIPQSPLGVSVVVGQGMLSASTVQTDAEGEADLPAWTVDAEPGPQSVQVEAGEASLVVSVNAFRNPATVSVPEGRILAGGHVHDESATVDESQLVVIVTDDGAYAHFPLTGGDPDLSPEGTSRAIREWMLTALGAEESQASPSGVLPTYDPLVGVDVHAVSSTTHRFRNEKSRAAALRFRDQHGQEERLLFPPRGSFFDVDLVASFQQRSVQFSSLATAEVDREIHGPSEVLGIGSIVTGKFVAGSLPLLAWNNTRSQILDAWEADRDLFLAVNGFDVGHLTFEFVRALVSFIPLECAEQLVNVILLEPGLALAEGAFEEMFEDLLVTDDPNRAANDIVWVFAQAALACACDAKTVGICSVLPLALDVISAAFQLVDLGLRSWDVYTTPSFAEGYLALAPIWIPVPSLGRLTVGEPFEHELVAEGGTGSYAWSVGVGALPPGIGLDPETGVLSGTPTESGEFGATIEARSGGLVGTVSLLFLVDGPSDGSSLVGSWQAKSIDGEPLPILDEVYNDCEYWLTELALDFRSSGELWLKVTESRECPDSKTTLGLLDSGTWEVPGQARIRLTFTHLRDYENDELVWESTGYEDVLELNLQIVGSELHLWEDGPQSVLMVFERGSIDFPPLSPPSGTSGVRDHSVRRDEAIRLPSIIQRLRGPGG